MRVVERVVVGLEGVRQRPVGTLDRGVPLTAPVLRRREVGLQGGDQPVERGARMGGHATTVVAGGQNGQ